MRRRAPVARRSHLHKRTTTQRYGVSCFLIDMSGQSVQGIRTRGGGQDRGDQAKLPARGWLEPFEAERIGFPIQEGVWIACGKFACLPLICSAARSWGMAMISLLLLAPLSFPSISPKSVAKALTGVAFVRESVPHLPNSMCQS